MGSKISNRFVSMVTLMVIAISIPVTVLILQSGSLDLRFQAFGSDQPRNVVISDVKSNSFRVSWTTEKPVQGGIRLVGEAGRAPIISEDSTSKHSVQVTSLTPGTPYEFSVLSDGREHYDTGTSYFNVTTATSNYASGRTFLIYGQVFAADGLSFQQQGIVELHLTKSGVRSQTLATALNEAGGFQFNLDGLQTADLTAPFDYSSEVDATVSIHVPNLDTESETRKYTVNLINNKQLPNVYLGDVTFEVIPGVDGTQ